MTDRLSTLLHAEATGLDVPPAPIDAVLAGGHAIRRRRRTTFAVIGAAAAVAVVAAGVALLGADQADRSPEPAELPDQAAYQQRGAWAQGDELHVGNHTAVVPGLAEILYTSVGVVARGTDDSLVLVTPAGAVEQLDLPLLTDPVFDPKVATDPMSPNLAYISRAGSGRGRAVVRDLATGEETTVGAPFPDTGAGRVNWLSGDLVAYSGAGGNGRTVDWRTGEPSSRARQGWWHAAGVSVNYDGDTWTLSTFDGDPLLTQPADAASSYGSLSPDGRYFVLAGTEPGLTVYDVRSGEETVFDDRAAVGYGWTPDGHLLGSAPGGGEIEVCDPVSGACEVTGPTSTTTPLLVRGTPGSAV